MMLKTHLLIGLCVLFISASGCGVSGNHNPIAPEPEQTISNAPSADHGPGGMLVGAYMIQLDGSLFKATTEPVRMPSAIGDPFLLGIGHTGPAGKWFDISGVELLNHDDVALKDTIRLTVRFKHPFSIDRRPDLCGWDLKAILVYNNPTPYNFSDFNAKINQPVLVNAYGATKEWDSESDLLYPTVANMHQFVIISEDPTVSDPFDFHNPSGWNVFYPGMIAEGNLDILLDSGSSLNFLLFLTMGYEQSSTFANTVNHPGEPGSRTNPIYDPPNGNNRSPWKVIISETGDGMLDVSGSETTYQVKIWDWQHAEAGTMSQVKRIQVSIPQVTSSPITVQSFTGDGRGITPLVADFTVTNSIPAPAGDYPSLIKVKDNMTGLPGMVQGVKTDWKTPFDLSEFDTYMFFNHHVKHYDPVNTDLFDQALTEMDMVRDDLHWGSAGDKFWKNSDEANCFPEPTGMSTKMPDFAGDDGYWKNPMQFPGYADAYTNDLKAAVESGDYSGIVAAISRRVGYPLDPLSYSYTPTSSPLLDSISALHQALGSPLTPLQKNTIQTDAMDIPDSVQKIAAKCLTAAKIAHPLRESAWQPFGNQQKSDTYDGYVTFSTVMNMDYELFNRAGAEIAAAFEDIKPDLAAFSDAGNYSFSWTTPIGKVVIKGNGDDTWADDDYLLALDVGGNDTYNGSIAGNNSLANSVSMAIDFSGNDHYGDATTVTAQGAAYVGIAALWDYSGDDVYTGDLYSQGSAYFGCGFLIDSAGIDHYNGDQIAQGSGYWGGTAFLFDEAGNDRYYSFQFSQGFGYVRSGGALIDASGDDEYVADDTDIRYPSAQTQDHNASLSQGMGFGYRNDPTYFAGGIGALVDMGGIDKYSCGVFGQSCAFMYSTGILRDYGPGNDTFYGIWYVQSATAHMGVTYLANDEGNDTYECTMNVGQGGGHHYSHSWFFDYAGDDIYTAPGISLGGGNDCGLGVFIDYDGLDTYHSTSSSSVGGANYSTTFNHNSYGVFVDDGGDVDTYDKPICLNDDTWHDGSIGGGADGQS